MLSIIILLPALATAIPLIKRQTQPDIITITDAQTSGNGCPQGSVSTSLSPDGTVRIHSLSIMPHQHSNHESSLNPGCDIWIRFVPDIYRTYSGAG